MKKDKLTAALAEEVAEVRSVISKTLVVPPPSKPDRTISDGMAQRMMERATTRAERRKALMAILSPGSPSIKAGEVVKVNPPEAILVPANVPTERLTEAVQKRGRGR